MSFGKIVGSQFVYAVSMCICGYAFEGKDAFSNRAQVNIPLPCHNFLLHNYFVTMANPKLEELYEEECRLVVEVNKCVEADFEYQEGLRVQDNREKVLENYRRAEKDLQDRCEALRDKYVSLKQMLCSSPIKGNRFVAKSYQEMRKQNKSRGDADGCEPTCIQEWNIPFPYPEPKVWIPSRECARSSLGVAISRNNHRLKNAWHCRRHWTEASALRHIDKLKTAITEYRTNEISTQRRNILNSNAEETEHRIDIAARNLESGYREIWMPDCVSYIRLLKSKFETYELEKGVHEFFRKPNYRARSVASMNGSGMDHANTWGGPSRPEIEEISQGTFDSAGSIIRNLGSLGPQKRAQPVVQTYAGGVCRHVPDPYALGFVYPKGAKTQGSFDGWHGPNNWGQMYVRDASMKNADGHRQDHFVSVEDYPGNPLRQTSDSSSNYNDVPPPLSAPSPITPPDAVPAELSIAQKSTPPLRICKSFQL